MNLPTAPKDYSQEDQSRLRAALSRADDQNLKRGRNIVLPDGSTVGDLPGDLSDIAALTTTAYGRDFLTLADAAAARLALALGTAATQASTAFQPADTDLTAIAALTTTSFGRGLLTVADAAAARTTVGAQASSATLTSLASASSNGVSLVTAANYAAMKVLLNLSNIALTSGTAAGLVADTWQTLITHASGDGQGVYLLHATTSVQVGHGFAIVSVYGSNVAVLAQWTSGTVAITFQNSGLNIQAKTAAGASTQALSWRACRI